MCKEMKKSHARVGRTCKFCKEGLELTSEQVTSELLADVLTTRHSVAC